MRSLWLWSLIASCLFGEVLTRNDVINIVLKSNPDVQISTANTHIGQSRVGQARSTYLPQASATAGVEHSDGDTLTADNHLIAGASASQLIVDFGKTSGAIDGAQERYEASKFDLTTTQNDVVYNGLKGYYEVLKHSHLIGVQEESVAMNDQQLYQAKEYYKAGVRAKIDVTNAQLELSNSHLDLLKARSNLDVSRANFEQILGVIPFEGNYRLDEESLSMTDLLGRVKLIGETLEHLKLRALQNRPELAASTQRIESSKSDIRSTDGEYYPSISAKANYQYTDSTAPLVIQNQYNGGVYANWEFFTGFRTDAKIQEAKANLLATKAQEDKIRLSIVSEVTNAYNLAKFYYEAINLQKIAVQLGRENLQLSHERYKAGIADMIELNDAQVKYTQAKTNFVVVYYDYNSALATIDYAVGKIIP